jgi:hypothetical protein
VIAHHAWSPSRDELNSESSQWALGGNWKDDDQVAAALAADASISFRFHARDLHLVLGPPVDGKAVRFRVTIDGHAPGTDHGLWIRTQRETVT